MVLSGGLCGTELGIGRGWMRDSCFSSDVLGLFSYLYHKYKLILIFKSRSISVETLKSKLFFSGRLMASISCSLSFCPVPTKEICTCCCGSCMNVTGNQGVGKGLGSGAVILSERERKEGCGMVEDYPHVHTQDCVHGPGHPFPFSSHHSVPMSSSSLRAIGSPKF